MIGTGTDQHLERRFMPSWLGTVEVQDGAASMYVCRRSARLHMAEPVQPCWQPRGPC